MVRATFDKKLKELQDDMLTLGSMVEKLLSAPWKPSKSEI